MSDSREFGKLANDRAPSGRLHAHVLAVGVRFLRSYSLLPAAE